MENNGKYMSGKGNKVFFIWVEKVTTMYQGNAKNRIKFKKIAVSKYGTKKNIPLTPGQMRCLKASRGMPKDWVLKKLNDPFRGQGHEG